MAETKTPEESTLPSKRKPDPSCQDNEGLPNKTQKLQTPNNSLLSQDETRNPDQERADTPDNNKTSNNNTAAEDNDDEEDSDGDNAGETNKVDRKGKGILLEEEGEDDDDNDDDDDSSDDGTDGDSDLSEDPLAEVDLENILPSRTRRKVTQPGDYISNDPPGNDDDDSDSDDDDA